VSLSPDPERGDRRSADNAVNGIGCRGEFLGVGGIDVVNHLAIVVAYFSHFAAIVGWTVIPCEVIPIDEVGRETDLLGFQ
jgi:hypothetical protein